MCISCHSCLPRYSPPGPLAVHAALAVCSGHSVHCCHTVPTRCILGRKSSFWLMAWEDVVGQVWGSEQLAMVAGTWGDWLWHGYKVELGCDFCSLPPVSHCLHVGLTWKGPSTPKHLQPGPSAEDKTQGGLSPWYSVFYHVTEYCGNYLRGCLSFCSVVYKVPWQQKQCKGFILL